jgi:acetyl-CoA C-acetyltransferase
MVCGSGLATVALGAQAIAPRATASIVVAGGQESMSLSHPCRLILRAGQKMGDLQFHRHHDPRRSVGLPSTAITWACTAENVAKEWQITREDRIVSPSPRRTKPKPPRKAGRFKDEIVAVTVKGRKGDTVVDTDEYIRDGATMRRSPVCARPLTRPAPSRRQCLGHQ